MRPSGVNDLDFLGALVHGRRSRLAEGKRLDALCRLRTLPELVHTLYPDSEFHAAAEFQSRLVKDFAAELVDLLRYLEGSGAELLAWILARFQVENIKVMVRGLVNHVPFQELWPFIVPLPHGLELDVEVFVKAESLDDFIARLPQSMPRRWLKKAAASFREQARTFFLEAALDGGYFQELLACTEALPNEELELLRPLVLQEVDSFHLMLTLRGKFHYGLTPEQLLPLHVPGSGITTGRFAAMCADPEPLTAAARAVGRALDSLSSSPETAPRVGTPELSVFEALAWQRFLRLANRAFRRSHMGLGTVVGYLGIRRVEVANLITLSEAIRTGLAAEAISPRLIPRQDLEPAYV